MVGTSCVILITISLGFSIYCESPADFYDQFLIGSLSLLYNVIQWRVQGSHSQLYYFIFPWQTGETLGEGSSSF